MTYLLDSDWVINFLKGRERYRQLLEPLRREGIAISTISIAEILTGIIGQGNESEKLADLDAFLEPIQTIPFAGKVLFSFAKVRSDLLKRHVPLENFDIAIAATAIEYNLTLLTGNLAHYKRVKGLKLFPALTSS